MSFINVPRQKATILDFRQKATILAQDAVTNIKKGAAFAGEKIRNIQPSTVNKVMFTALGVLYALIAPIPTSVGFLVGLACADKVNKNLADINAIYKKQSPGVKILALGSASLIAVVTFPVVPGFVVGMVAGAKLRKA